MSSGSLTPAIIASWPAPNYVDPITRGAYLQASVIVLQIVVAAVVAARLYARFFMLKSPGIDDFLLIFAMLPNTALNISLLLAVYKYDFGRHVWDVPPSLFIGEGLVTFLIQLFSHWSTSFTKLSILFFYRRLVVGSHSKTFLRIVKAAIIFQVAAAFTVAVTIFLDCRPLDALWLSYGADYTTPYTCIKNGTFWPIMTAIAVITDFIATLLPSYIVHRLQIPKLQKRLMYAIFSLGFLVCLAGLARMIEYIYVLNDTWDVSWAAYLLWYWTALEANGAIICACAPALKPYIDRYLVKKKTSQGSSPSSSKFAFGQSFTSRRHGLSTGTTAVSEPRASYEPKKSYEPQASYEPRTSYEPKLSYEAKPLPPLPQQALVSKYNTNLPAQGITSGGVREKYSLDGMTIRQSEEGRRVKDIRNSEIDIGDPDSWFQRV